MSGAAPAALCIGVGDPAFLVAIAAGTIAAFALGRTIGRQNLVWFASLVTVVVGPLLLQSLVFSWMHPGLELCTSAVGNYFFLPPVVLFATGFFRASAR